MNKIIKTIQLSIITSALIAGAAAVNAKDVVESTDVMRSEAHVATVSSDQQATINAVEHNQALIELEGTGDVDHYIETNNTQESNTRSIPKCDNLSVPSGVKDSIHCE
ncbi:hypothetical protein VIN01S_06620 [Vibrio inusitatus NBRC 102082]|uniref:Uncharacterized protein n=1 Tax=Vibrio inusitatus NBRC 102082 TaxID=1219070 RepID=A0A4Y3HS40_9VIBR|nr:hypothetical protein [Vibrio inusitatus]GEA49858.1 hypothetical protein VIN01S_06620 [Vibrio inusitatus NBRC 102082]